MNIDGQAVPTFELSLSSAPDISMIGAAQAGTNTAFSSAVQQGTWWIHLFRYRTEIVLDGVTYPLEPGDLTFLPPGTTVGLTFPKSAVHHAMYFSFPQQNALRPYKIQTIYRLGGDYLPVSQEIDQIMIRRAIDPMWGNSMLWSLLFRLASHNIVIAPHPSITHPAVGTIALVIDHQMMKPLTAAELAQFTGLSLTHVNRLFNATFGMSIMSYFRRQRMQRAYRLLRESDIPIASIAAMVGVPQVQHFNKLVHKTYGMSPTKLRRP